MNDIPFLIIIWRYISVRVRIRLTVNFQCSNLKIFCVEKMSFKGKVVIVTGEFLSGELCLKLKLLIVGSDFV
jgi:hypothetical protein